MKAQVYKSNKKNEYGWRIRSNNGRIIAVGGETFATKRNAIRAMDTCIRNLKIRLIKFET